MGQPLGAGLPFAVFQHKDPSRSQKRGIVLQKFHHRRRPSFAIGGICKDDVERAPLTGEIGDSTGHMGADDLDPQRLSLLKELSPLLPKKLHRHHRRCPPPGCLKGNLPGSCEEVEKGSSLQRT
jgi:hypothetical protein